MGEFDASVHFRSLAMIAANRQACSNRFFTLRRLFGIVSRCRFVSRGLNRWQWPSGSPEDRTVLPQFTAIPLFNCVSGRSLRRLSSPRLGLTCNRSCQPAVHSVNPSFKERVSRHASAPGSQWRPPSQSPQPAVTEKRRHAQHETPPIRSFTIPIAPRSATHRRSPASVDTISNQLLSDSDQTQNRSVLQSDSSPGYIGSEHVNRVDLESPSRATATVGLNF